jgi:hypothetical protein
VYGTESEQEVEEYFESNGIAYSWGENVLYTSYVTGAAIEHFQLGQKVWFNQAHAFHLSSLSTNARKTVEKYYRELEIPNQAYYGDGSKIDDEDIQIIREAYKKVWYLFDWEKGDILMLDNMLISHGRLPFEGERRILVMMGGVIDRRKKELI